MSYAGTTASSSLQNLPFAVIPAMSGPKAQTSGDSTSIARRGKQLWMYNTSDATSVMCTPGYFTDGYALGMRVNDLIMGISWSSYSCTAQNSFFGGLYSTNSTGGFNLSTDTMVTSSFT